MLQLQAFLPADWVYPANWVANQEELTQFAGTEFVYPLDEKQIADFLAWPNHEVFKVSWKDQVVGMAEVIYVGNTAARIGRVIIGEKGLRGQGVGEKLMRKLRAYIQEDLGRPTVRLYVLAFNKGAIRCYEKSGFVFTGQNTVEVRPGDKDWLALEMEWKE